MSPAFQTVTTTSTGTTRNMEDERRCTLQLINYWDKIRNDRSLPVENDIDPDHNALHNIWHQCFIVQVRDFENKEFNYTYLGPGIIDAYREELIEHPEAQIVSLSAAKLMDTYKHIMHERKPLIVNSEFTDRKSNNVKFRQCLLPFGHDKVEVIFGHMTYTICK